jgi:hypothetical protein
MKQRKNIFSYILLLPALALIIPFISSCGKGRTNNAVGLNVQFQIVNLSPDLHPVDLYVAFHRASGSYYYPSPSGYFAVNTVDTPLQIRPAVTSGTASTYNILSVDTVLKANTKYTWFVTGLVQDTVKGIFAIDTAHAPAVGRGKIRFLNASPRSTGLDIIANGTTAFSNIQFNNLTSYMEIPSGNYTFKLVETNNPTIVLKQLPSVSVSDGKLYTLYTYGLVGRTDTAAFGAGVITNR